MAEASFTDIEAVLFDLDGVLTSTAALHRAAWTESFDAVLAEVQSVSADRSAFTEEDYLRWVDGRPRLDGVRTFLASRGITLPPGEPDDAADELTVAGVGARKNAAFQRLLAASGVEPLPGAVELLECLTKRGTRTALVSASRNAPTVLQAAGLAGYFDAQIDGEVAAQRGLRGKPYPDTFLAAAADLGVDPARAAVIEDAISGVEAARAGGFGLVIGISESGSADLLVEQGADLVVRALEDLLPRLGC